MLKLVKYEFRRSLVSILIIFGGLLALEAYIAFSIIGESGANIAISVMLYVLAGFAGVILLMVLGVVSYSRELSSKSSFMTFMTPNSTFKIVGAKYISVFSVSLAATLLYVLFIALDYQLAKATFDEITTVQDFLDELLIVADTSVGEMVALLVSMFISILMSILLIVSFAYFAITLSATLLANKKGKGWLSFGFFVVIYVITTIISNHLPTFDFGDGLMELVAGSWISYLFEIVLIVGAYLGVSVLLKKKVSL